MTPSLHLNKYLNTSLHFSEAEKRGLLEESFIWITTDAITTKPEALKVNGKYNNQYLGILGIEPSYGRETVDFMTMQQDYIDAADNHLPSDITLTSVKISQAIKLVHGSIETNSEFSPPSDLSCNSKSAWNDGKAFRDTINKNLKDGKYVSYNSDLPTYDIMNFKNIDNGFERVGMWQQGTQLVDLNEEKVSWHKRRDIKFIGGGYTPPSGITTTLSGYHLKIGILPFSPLAFITDSCSVDFPNITSPQCWDGWNPQLFKRLSKELKFTYEFYMPEDGKWGGFHDGKWNGLVKALIDHKIDICVALSINTLRSSYIGFTSSFYEDEAAFVYKMKPSSSSSNMFFFMEPFDITVWISILLLTFIIGAIISFFGKLSPYGFYGRNIHAMQCCQCSKCESRRSIKIIRKCRLACTKSYECLVDEAEESNYLCDLSVYNSTWLTSTGT